MVDATAQRVGVEQATDGALQDEVLTTAQSGSVSFPELVRAHYAWEKVGCVDGPEAERFRAALAEFQKREGELKHVYWARKRPSAVALTVRSHEGLRGRFTDQDAQIRLHRATDWLAREQKIAELMHHCDTLAIRVSEVLKGTSERIAMQWIYAVQSHLLGFIERTSGRADKAAFKKELDGVRDSQTDELIEIERYYTRAATKAARLVYTRGMLIGTVGSALLGLLLAYLVWESGWFDEPDTRSAQTFLVCFSAGAVGALVSVLTRMSSNQFRVDYEVGRATIWKLGSFRPFIGAIFGVMLFFIVKSGLLSIDLSEKSDSETFFFYGTLAFLTGFNERFTNVLFGKAEQTIAASLGDSSAKRRRRQDEAEDED